MSDIVEKVAPLFIEFDIMASRAAFPGVDEKVFRDAVAEAGEAHFKSLVRFIAKATIQHLSENVSEGMIDAGVQSDHGKTLGSRSTNCFRAMLSQALTELEAK